MLKKLRNKRNRKLIQNWLTNTDINNIYSYFNRDVLELRKIQKCNKTGNIRKNATFACWITKATDTLRICNTYCSYTATKVTRTCLNVTLYVQCLSCLNPMWNVDFWRRDSPIRLGNVTQAGPGLEYSAAIGPRLFVGVHGCCWMPPMFLCFTHNSEQTSVIPTGKLKHNNNCYCISMLNNNNNNNNNNNVRLCLASTASHPVLYTSIIRAVPKRAPIQVLTTSHVA